jgi:hypothetical protein
VLLIRERQEKLILCSIKLCRRQIVVVTAVKRDEASGLIGGVKNAAAVRNNNLRRAKDWAQPTRSAAHRALHPIAGKRLDVGISSPNGAGPFLEALDKFRLGRGFAHVKNREIAEMQRRCEAFADELPFDAALEGGVDGQAAAEFDAAAQAGEMVRQFFGAVAVRFQMLKGVAIDQRPPEPQGAGREPLLIDLNEKRAA